jgi:hypothetical protein
VRSEVLFAPQIARALGISEEQVFELARTRGVPFFVSSHAPRQLGCGVDELPLWRRAAEAME